MRAKGKLFILSLSAAVIVYALVGLFYDRVAAKDDAYKELKIFIDVLKKVDDDYVEKPNVQKAMDGAMKGLVEALDPYSSYLSKEKIEAIEKRKETAKADIGVELSKRGGLIYVVSPISGGPADLTGIRPGDYIDTIDDKSVADASLYEAYDLLRGAENSQAKVSVIRSYITEPVEIKVKRELPKSPPISTRMITQYTGLIKVPYLAQGSAQQFKERLSEVIGNGAKRIILDLRNTPGGEFEEGIAIANLFLKNGVIVHIKTRDGNRIAQEARSEQFICDLPVAVLANHGTAGAAEIIVGTILDNKRGQVVGEKTFGAASKQKTIPLRNGSVLIISVEKYFTPSGKSIQDESAKLAGVTPTIVFPTESYKSDLFFKAYFDESAGKDEKYKKLIEKIENEQLEKAIEVLNGKEGKVEKAA